MAGGYKKGEGVPDFVLLDALTEDAVFENMRLRYNLDLIYTYIGEVVVSVNPFKNLPIYDQKHIEDYRGRYMYERPPHIYALANNAYRGMIQNKANQCIIISGESGAGKTEASKIIMRYIAAVSTHSAGVDHIKTLLLESNPVLEAFGNAKTLRNDNSSRFGKYMEILFDYNGAPAGGRITNYLLEKVRVVNRTVGERSFHIFYNLLAGANEELLRTLQLKRDPSGYRYLAHSQAFKVDTIDDGADWRVVLKSMTTLGFSAEEQTSMWRVIGAILHLGNVEFANDAAGAHGTGTQTCSITNTAVVQTVAQLLQCDYDLLRLSLLSRSISTGVGKRGSIIKVPLDAAQAAYARDALAKGVYSRLFSWLVERINRTFHVERPEDKLVIGLLDIYGFEILERNSFEQLCINYCNEKLQQLFIELTLKSEQEEYVREGIKWEQIKYFNNKIICDLIEGKPISMVSLLDETCLLADSSDQSFLTKCQTHFARNDHFETYQKSRDRKIPDDAFKIKHYAGEVTYHIQGMLDKNKDTLFSDSMVAMQSSRIALVAELFPQQAVDSKKRPVTAGTQFKEALNVLITKLLQCRPHYVRCVKSNNTKRPGGMDEQLTRHQIRYLGLVENVRVRRAGFAYRMPYERFLGRYKMLGGKETWPTYKGSARDGTARLLAANGVGNTDDVVAWGKTKLFIRNPTTLFLFEERRDAAMPRIVTLMQKVWRGYREKRTWLKRKAATKIVLWYRRAKCRRWILQVAGAFANVRQDVPRYGRDTAWPAPPRILAHANTLLQRVWRNWRAKMLVTALTPEQRAVMRLKVQAYDLFHNKKPWALARKFDSDYLALPSNPHLKKYVQHSETFFQRYGDQQVLFADYTNKISPKSKTERRGITVTEQNLYKHDAKNFKVKKHALPLQRITGVTMSPYRDCWVLLHYTPPDRDLILDLGFCGEERLSEFVAVLAMAWEKLMNRDLPITFATSATYNNNREQSKPGVQRSLTWAQVNDPKLTAATWKKGAKEANSIQVPQSLSFPGASATGGGGGATASTTTTTTTTSTAPASPR